MLYLYLQAPFATFRTFSAGNFRPTAGFITHSAAYGLLLNVAGLEMRRDDARQPMTLIKQDLPKFRLALGALSLPLEHTAFQQLHNYRVGETKEVRDEGMRRCKGNKYNVTPCRRAFLSDIRAYLCLGANAAFEERVRNGLRDNSPRSYGLPFLGDNNFLIDRLEPVDDLRETFWFTRITSDRWEGMKLRVTRLTISIDRADMSKTRSALFAPTEESTTEIPEDAWVEVGY